MSTLKDLLAKKQALEAQQQELDRAIEAERGKALKSLKVHIEALCAEQGTSVEELFGSRKRKATAPVPGIGKYWLHGSVVDGRVARGMKEFDSVRTDGKIDDAKALAANMINPEWLASKRPAARRLVKEQNVDVAAYQKARQ